MQFFQKGRVINKFNRHVCVLYVYNIACEIVYHSYWLTIINLTMKCTYKNTYHILKIFNKKNLVNLHNVCVVI